MRIKRFDRKFMIMLCIAEQGKGSHCTSSDKFLPTPIFLLFLWFSILRLNGHSKRENNSKIYSTNINQELRVFGFYVEYHIVTVYSKKKSFPIFFFVLSFYIQKNFICTWEKENEKLLSWFSFPLWISIFQMKSKDFLCSINPILK